MKILFVAHSFPYPLHEGVRLHVYYLLKYLSARHDVHLITFIESNEERKHIPKIQNFCNSITVVLHQIPKQPWRRFYNMLFQPEPYSVCQFKSSTMHDTILRLKKEIHPDVIHIDYMSMAQYAPLMDKLPKVFFPHDAVSMLFERNVARERNLLFQFYMASQAKKMKAYETKVLPWFEKTVVVSPVDQTVLQNRSPNSKIDCNPNGVDTDYFQPLTYEPKSNVVLFRGVMNFLPNYDAATFFARKVMPKVWEARANTELWIAGGSVPKAMYVLFAREPRIHLIGFVPDLRVPMAEAAVIACPMRIGSGIKNKILESLAMEKAIVATPMSLAGIDAIAGQHLLVGESAEELAEQTLRLLNDEPLRNKLGQEGRKLVIKNHSWSDHVEKFAQIYNEVVRPLRDDDKRQQPL